MNRGYFSLLLPLLLLVSGFKMMPPQQTPEKAAQEAAESWLRLIDSGKYAESWDELAQITKAEIPKDSWEKLRSSARKPGDAEESKPRKLRGARFVPELFTMPGQAGVVLEYNTHGPHSSVVEAVELVLEAGRGWRVADYIGMSFVRLHTPSSGAGFQEKSWVESRSDPSVEPYFGRAAPGTPPITTPFIRKNPKGGTIVFVAKKDLPVTIETVDGTGGGIGLGTGGSSPTEDLSVWDKAGNGAGKGGGIGSGAGIGPPALGGDRNGVAADADQRPVPLNAPQPRYTEAARKNKIQGIVVARVLVGADGLVKQVRITRGLPDGLDEQAIQAAYQLRFRPAMKDGKPVAFWESINMEFHLK